MDSKIVRTPRSPGEKQEAQEMKMTFFNQTAPKLYSTNFQHLDELSILDDNCNCGRHL